MSGSDSNRCDSEDLRLTGYRSCALRLRALRALPASLALLGLGTAIAAQAAPERAPAAGWNVPPPEIVALLDAPPTPGVDFSPDARWMLLVERPSMPSLAEVNRPWIGLAGRRIDPRLNAPKRDLYDNGLVLRELATERERRVALPAGARIAGLSWAPDSQRFAFTLAHEERVDLYVCTVADARVLPIARGLNTVALSYAWLPGSRELLVPLIPANRGAAPSEPEVPSAPAIQQTSGTATPVRTYQDLLQDPHDEALFEHYGGAQLAIASVDGGTPRALGPVALYAEIDPAPDGKHVLVGRIERPYSYQLPASSFATTYEVWSLAAGGPSPRTIAKLPLAEGIPIEGVRTGPRGIGWQQSAPATLTWFEALDGGDPRTAAPQRDRVLALAAPFTGEAREIARVQHRARSLRWLADSALALITEYDRDKRWTRSQLVRIDGAEVAPVVLDDRNVNDRYGDPGSFVAVLREDGSRVLRQDGPWLYRSGLGADKQGARPFLDRQNLATLATERLWRCEPGSYESLLAIATSSADAPPTVITRYESPSEPPNVRARELGSKSVRALTAFPDPQPALRGAHKELIQYARADGVQLSATVHLPPGHQPGTRLPLVVWAYPLEYSDADTAGQVSSSPHRFTRISGPSHLFMLLRGYAILDDATIPIVGDPLTMNDTFLEQMSSSAEAALAEAERRGFGDRTRAGVGGHSYGAFMTANLLAHTDLFRAGIARSGAYNRTLTPFGFQSERRTLWEAPDTYARLSPFFHADKIKEPLLLIHGEKDSNAGTFPMQSERLYQALQGHGAHARFVKLPAEDHGYRARESVLHCLAEMIEWFDAHVAGAPQAELAGSATPGLGTTIEASSTPGSGTR